MRSQIRVGFGGFVGFDYTALRFVLEAKDIPREDWGDILNMMNQITTITAKFIEQEEKKK